ncbi:MAG: HAD hydrolase family protein [Hydrogenophaga sp.]|nr:HAD hydrolase family protein [Hydrogenophaga sp.]
MPTLQPVLSFDAALLQRAQTVCVVFFDVDGVLTDGGLLFSDQGETLKRFNTLDGHGIKLLQRAGITPAVVTGRDSAALRERLRALGVTHARFGTEDKLPAAEAILAELGLDWSQAAAMGDDWPDLPMMRRAAFACAPCNAHAEVLAQAHWVTPRTGGNGAVRELCDLLMLATGTYDRLLQVYGE